LVLPRQVCDFLKAYCGLMKMPMEFWLENAIIKQLEAELDIITLPHATKEQLIDAYNLTKILNPPDP